MSRPRKVRFRIEFDLPPGADADDAEECLVSHVVSMGGDRRPPGGYGENDPGDPMFGLDRDSIAVQRLKR